MKGYRTLLLNLTAALLGVLVATDWVALTDPRTAGAIVTGLGIANAALRFLTDGPVGGGTGRA